MVLGHSVGELQSYPRTPVYYTQYGVGRHVRDNYQYPAAANCTVVNISCASVQAVVVLACLQPAGVCSCVRLS